MRHENILNTATMKKYCYHGSDQEKESKNIKKVAVREVERGGNGWAAGVLNLTRPAGPVTRTSKAYKPGH